PSLFGPDGVIVLDPAAKRPELDVFSIGRDQLDVRLYAVTPSDFSAYSAAIQEMWSRGRPPRFPGRKVVDRVVKVDGGKDHLVETHIDLAPALAASGLGHAIAVVALHGVREDQAQQLIAWVQSTRLGIDAHIDHDGVVAHATELGSGTGAAGVALEIAPYGITGATDERGLATLPLGAGPRRGNHFLIARRAGDVAFIDDVDETDSEEGSRWFRQPRRTELAWYVTDDRRMYRPGEEVSLKGWLRAIDPNKNGDVGWTAGQVSSVSYRVSVRGKQIASGAAAVNAV